MDHKREHRTPPLARVMGVGRQQHLLSNVPQDCGTQKQFLKTCPIFQQHMGEFNVYLKKAMDGDLGPTAQYWSMYVHMVNRVHMDLMRTLRTNDVDGYIKILPAMIDIFLD